MSGKDACGGELERERGKKMPKEFDSTICFSFFADWLEAIEYTETEADRKSESYMLFKAIANYALYGEVPDFDTSDANKSFKRFWPMLEKQIDSSIKSRKRWFKDGSGPTENAKKVIDAYKKNPDASIRDIAEVTGVSKSEVNRIKRKYIRPESAPKMSTTSDPIPKPNPSPSGIPIPSPNVNPNNSPNPNANTGHGTGGDTGQQEEWRKPHIPILDKILDYLWEKHNYGKVTVEFDEDGEEVFEFKPALFYIPPDAWKHNDGSTDSACPASIRDRWDNIADDGGEMPF